MSKILLALKIFNFEDLYISSKLSFLNSIKDNEIAKKIFINLCNSQRNSRSKSFIQDIRSLEKRFDSSIADIYSDSKKCKEILLNKFNDRDGITDSIRHCIANYKNKNYQIILANLIKPKFIQEDEEFQELLQYFLISND